MDELWRMGVDDDRMVLEWFLVVGGGDSDKGFLRDEEEEHELCMRWEALLTLKAGRREPAFIMPLLVA